MSKSTRPTFLLAAVIVVSAPVAASAHPHVWVNAKAEVIFDKYGSLTAVRHTWLFDPDFSAYATLNIDANNDGKLSPAELKPLVETNMDALKEYDFFTHLYIDNKSVAFGKPVDYHLEFHKDRLTLFYTLPLKAPLILHGAAMLEIGDPEYFVAIDFVKNQEVTLAQPPSGCTAQYRPPHELDAQTMTILSAVPIDQHDLPPNLVQAASLLQNIVTISCPGGRAAAVGDLKLPSNRPKTPDSSTLSPADLGIQPNLSAVPKADVVATQTNQGQAATTLSLSGATSNVTVIQLKSTTEPPQAAAPTAESGNWFTRIWNGMFGR